MSPVIHVELPALDLERAIAFHERVFAVTLERETVDGLAMAFFPVDGTGAGAALVTGDTYVPTHDGMRAYFRVDDIVGTVARAEAAGATVLYPVTDVGAYGHVAEFADSEGNRVALQQPRDRGRR
jgi:hypothetical protein